jgi:glutamyl-tRNA synthetase
MKNFRDSLQPDPCRNKKVAENLAGWEEMKKATELGVTMCLRAKIDYKSLNGTMRDPVIYRCVPDADHYITGTAFKVYPIYNFACPIIDSIEGVTHAMRSNEYHDSEEQYYWLLKNIPDLPNRNVKIKDFSRISFAYTVMSKRKLQWFVDQKMVDDWRDPRFPTIQGIQRRGLTIEALKKCILSQGDSRKDVNMDPNILWAINKQIIDRVIPRYTCVRTENAVSVTIEGMKGETEDAQIWKCKHNESLGKKTITHCNKIYLDQEDAKELVEQEEVTLMDWGNAIVHDIKREGDVVVSISAKLNLSGDFKTTKRKIHWVPQLPSLCNLDLVEYDTLVNIREIPKDKDFKEFVTPQSKFSTLAVSHPNIKECNVGDRIQFERMGYYILDAISEDKTKFTFVRFTDGHEKNLFLSCKVAVRK